MADRIGDFLIRAGAMQAWQVEAVLQVQQAGDTRLFGEIAVRLGYIRDDAVRRYVDYLERQE